MVGRGVPPSRTRPTLACSLNSAHRGRFALPGAWSGPVRPLLRGEILLSSAAMANPARHRNLAAILVTVAVISLLVGAALPYTYSEKISEDQRSTQSEFTDFEVNHRSHRSAWIVRRQVQQPPFAELNECPYPVFICEISGSTSECVVLISIESASISEKSAVETPHRSSSVADEPLR